MSDGSLTASADVQCSTQRSKEGYNMLRVSAPLVNSKSNSSLPRRRALSLEEDWKMRRQWLINMHHNPGKGSSELLPPSPRKMRMMKSLHTKSTRKRRDISVIEKKSSKGRGGWIQLLTCTSDDS
mmetsp:Transcript_32764/g.52750  ORF Transcript_32764/g.52750 Transcript_32764/m.52750 type:complete len:125 (-) Transcript_32764:320-694(-)